MTDHERALFYRDARHGLAYGILRGLLLAAPLVAAYFYVSAYHPDWIAGLFR